MQAVIGRIQLKYLSEWKAKRQQNASRLFHSLLAFAGARGVMRLPKIGCTACLGQCGDAGCLHAHYKSYSYIRPENLSQEWSRDRIVETIDAQGLPCFQNSCSEMYLEKAVDGTGWRPTEQLPIARELGETRIMFLMHPTLRSAEMDKSCHVIAQVLNEAGNVR